MSVGDVWKGIMRGWRVAMCELVWWGSIVVIATTAILSLGTFTLTFMFSNFLLEVPECIKY